MNEIKKQSIPFWSWNGALKKDEILRQIDDMHEKGYGGFIMHARSGLLTEYMSNEWMEMIKLSAKRAKELQMEAWIYDEYGWPSGFVGGELLKDENNRENYLEAVVGEYDESAYLSYDLSSESLYFARNESRKCLNIYIRTSATTVDVLDANVVDKFITATHKRYEELFDGDLKGNIAGFFTDEPQYYGRGTPFPHKIEEEFFAFYGEDLRNGLGLLFVEKQGYKEFRYKYRNLLQHLFLRNYAKKLNDYCLSRGVAFTGHYCEERDLYAQVLFCGGVMPFYEYMAMPGIDWLCRRFMTIVPPKQLESVAAQLGKEDTLSESFGMTGWDSTPSELKAIAEFQMMNGVTRICHHLLPYSENGYRKYDYPTHFTDCNTWTKRGMYEFNRYLDALSAFLKTHKQKIKVAVLHPVKTAYMYYKDQDLNSTAILDKGFLDFCEELCEDGLSYHFLDETIFARHGRINGSKLNCGQMQYDALIIPPQCESLESSTERFLQSFVRNGGKVWIAGDTPKYLEGEEHEFDFLYSTVSKRELMQEKEYDLRTMAKGLRSGLYEGEDGKYLFLLNTEFKEVADAECIVGDGYSLYRYDVITGEKYSTDGRIELPPCSSMLLKIEKQGKTVVKKGETKKIIPISFAGKKIERTAENILVLDKACRLEKDGKFSKEQSVHVFFNESLSKQEHGDIFLRFQFETKILPKNIFLVREKGQYTSTKINDTEVFEYQDCENESERVNIAPYLKLGVNEIILKTEFYQKASVYKAKDKNSTEGLSNKLVYDTWFDAIYLVGDFGVFAKTIKDGFNDSSLFMDEFYLDKPKSIVSDFISDGYPFYNGSATFLGTFTAEEGNAVLRLDGRNYCVETYVNEQYAGRFFFNRDLDVSAFTKTGVNQLKLVAYSSARNWLGPHHCLKEEENYWIYPTSFTGVGEGVYRKEYSLLKW